MGEPHTPLLSSKCSNIRRPTLKESYEKPLGATSFPSYRHGDTDTSHDDADDDVSDEGDYFPSGQRYPGSRIRDDASNGASRQYGVLHGRPISATAPQHLSSHEIVHVARPASALGASDRAALRAAAAAASVARNSGGGSQSNSKYHW